MPENDFRVFREAMAEEAIVAPGGRCAPLAGPRYDSFRVVDGPDEKRMLKAIDGCKTWINGAGAHFQVSIDAEVLTAANTDDEARLLLADHLARIAVEIYAKPPTIEELMPPISAPRGGIVYPTPPKLGGWPTPPERHGVRQKTAEAAGAARRGRQRVREARKRLRDARAVWRGDKVALTDAEYEELSDW